MDRRKGKMGLVQTYEGMEWMRGWMDGWFCYGKMDRSIKCGRMDG